MEPLQKIQVCSDKSTQVRELFQVAQSQSSSSEYILKLTGMISLSSSLNFKCLIDSL